MRTAAACMHSHSLGTPRNQQGRLCHVLKHCTSGHNVILVRCYTYLISSTAQQKATAELIEPKPRIHTVISAGLEEVVAAELMKAPIRAHNVNFVVNKAGVDFRCASAPLYTVYLPMDNKVSEPSNSPGIALHIACMVCWLPEGQRRDAL